jgi:pSer/pThr/pTyr-binding forkhead associated (FHA) protein
MGYFLPELSVAERIAMPVIKLNDQQFLLRPGTNRLGGGDLVEMSISPDVSLGVQAIVEVTGTEGVVIRPVAGKEVKVLVNGVPLAEPTPLLHGDKLEVAGKELSFSDDTKSGATTFVSRAEISAVTAATKAPPGGGPRLGEPIQLGETVRGPGVVSPGTTAAGATAAPDVATQVAGATGGRLVSLVDGREYPVPEAGLTIGRESGCDVVLAHKQVSRKHAMITPTLRGYELKDLSSNGVFVNGTKINGSQVLARADIIKIAKDEFRFYADATALAPTLSFQAFAPKSKTKTPRDSPSVRRTPSSSHAVASRLAHQDKLRVTGQTPLPSSQAVGQRGGAGSGFGWMWAVVLLALGFAAYYMIK